MKFDISAEKYLLSLNGKHLMESRRDSRHSGYVAIACSEALCEMKNLRVTLHKASQTAPSP
jgi:hypothetical protein